MYPKTRKELEALPKSEQKKIRNDYINMDNESFGKKYGVSRSTGALWFGKKGHENKATRKPNVTETRNIRTQPMPVEPPKGYYNFTETKEYFYLPQYGIS